MKNMLIYFLISLFTEGVFSETVSVKEGDSVTLSPQLTEIKKDDVMDWRFGGNLIARVRFNNNPSVYEDELGGKFRDRLKLNGQTGDLTITDIRKTDAGVYELSNIFNTIKKTFSVSVRGVFSETVSVKEGDSVTLPPQLTEIKKDDVIDWRFGGNLIARVRNNNIPSVYEDELGGKFRGRLKLDGQTGDLTITDIRKDDAGVYEVYNSINTFKKTFSVSVVSAGEVNSVSVEEGESVTLHTDLTEILRDEVIQWKFEHHNSPVAELNRQTGTISIYDGPDERFRDRLKLDNQTGSLTITDTRTTDSGDYKLEISSSDKHTIHKSFTVTVSVVPANEGVSVSVNEGDSVTLSPQLTEIKKDDVIDWRFGGILIARVRNNNIPSVYEDELGGKFRGRLKLDGQTGDLNITDFRKDDAGVYEVYNSINTFKKSFNVRVSGVFSETKSVSVKEGDSVTLFPQLTEIKNNDVIDWRFEGILIARVRNNNIPSVYEDELGGKFRDRLKLNGQTGDLTITNIRKDDAGVYEVYNSINTFKKTFNVSVSVELK